MRQYHLSYDTKEKREEILKVLLEKTQIKKVESFCESTLILHFETEQPSLFNTLSNELEDNFYFVLSAISQFKNPLDNSIKPVIRYRPTPKLNENLQIEWEELKKKLKK